MIRSLRHLYRLYSIIFGAFQNSSMLNFLIYENQQDSEAALSREIATNIVRHRWLKSIIVYREDGKVVADYAMQKISPIQQRKFSSRVLSAQYKRKNRQMAG